MVGIVVLTVLAAGCSGKGGAERKAQPSDTMYTMESAMRPSHAWEGAFCFLAMALFCRRALRAGNTLLLEGRIVACFSEIIASVVLLNYEL